MAGSFALGILLIAVVIRLGKIDLHLTLRQLRGVGWISLSELVLLNAVLVLISTEKWRCIDVCLRGSSDSAQPRTTSFALTSAGLALGTVLPVQVAMSAARSLGTYVHGSAIKRGTAGTLYEQSFDVLTLIFLSIASCITWLRKGGGTMWGASAVVMLALAMLTVGPCLRLIQGATDWVARVSNPNGHAGGLAQRFSRLLHSGVLSFGLARRLVLLSAARFIIIVSTSVLTARAIGLHIPLWQMAAAIPFVAIASVIALTPGALGINELSCAVALSLFGTPLTIGAQWAIANRLLVAISYFAVAACAATTLLLGRVIVPAVARSFQS